MARPTAVRMLATVQGSPNGAVVFTYKEGEAYGRQSSPRMSADLAEVLIREGNAEAIDETEAPVAEEVE